MLDSLPRPARLCFRVCAIGVLVALASRWLRYALPSLPGPLDALLGRLLSLELSLFTNSASLLLMIYPVLLPAIAIVLLVFRRRLFGREDGRRALHPALFSAVWVVFLLNHYLFDISPTLGWVSLLALLLASPWLWRRLAALGSRPRAALMGAVWLAFLGVVQLATQDYWPVRLGSAVVVALLASTTLVMRPFFVERDRLTFGVGCVIAAQFVAMGVPVFVQDGRMIGLGMAYSFCETPAGDRLFAAVPQCPTLPLGGSWEKCMDGYVGEYALPELEPVGGHRFFSDGYYGRIEQLVCFDDTVQIGMSSAIVDGVDLAQNAMEFDIDDPTQFRTNLAGATIGDRLAYDRSHDAVFYVGEWQNRIVRLDRRTGEETEWIPDWHRPTPIFLGLTLRGSLLLSRYSIHEDRNSIFFAEWMGGRYVHEADLETLELVRSYPHHDGGAIGVTVDEALGRLYVTGLWGLEVFDLETGEPIARRRLGFFSRVPVIDEHRGILYVPSTVEGRIRAFDRETLEELGSVAIGYGTRHPHVTGDGKHFLASSQRAFFRWSAEELANRMRGTPDAGGQSRGEAQARRAGRAALPPDNRPD